MAGRLTALVLLVSVALAPVALEVCQAACAVHAMAAANGEQHHHGAAMAGVTVKTTAVESPQPGHSCHDAAPVAGSGYAMTGAPHRCNHSDDLPVAAAALAQVTGQAPAVATIVFELAAPVRRFALFSIAPAASHPIPIAINLPLRV